MKTTDATELVPDHTLDDATYMESIPYYCDDCDTWHECWHGIQVEDGEIVNASCDTDGNWDYDGEGIAATPEACGVEWGKLHKEGERARRSYDQHCADTGADPMENYYVKYTTKTTHHVATTLQKHVAMPEHGPRITSMLVDGVEVDPLTTHKAIRDYYSVSQKAGHTVCGETDVEFWDSCDWNKDGTLVHTEAIDQETPRSDEDVAADIREIAERALKERK